MPTYVVLFAKTTGDGKITAEDAKRRRAKGREIDEEYGTEIGERSYGLGEYEMVAIVEAPDSSTPDVTRGAGGDPGRAYRLCSDECAVDVTGKHVPFHGQSRDSL